MIPRGQRAGRQPDYDRIRAAGMLRMPHCLGLVGSWGSGIRWTSETTLRYDLSDRGRPTSWTMDLETGRRAPGLDSPSAGAAEPSHSPQGRWQLRRHAGGIQLAPASAAAGWQTISGAPLRPGEEFGGHSGIIATAGRSELAGDRDAPVVVWSPDDRYVVYQGLDESELAQMPLTENDPPGDGAPRLRLHRQAIHREPGRARVRMLVYDTQTARTATVDLDVGPVTWLTPLELHRVFWPDLSEFFYVVTSTLGERELRLHEVDPRSGAARLVLTERSATFAETNLDIGGARPNVAVLPRTRKVIWFSERSGWGHLYLHDLDTGELVRPLTAGEWVVRSLERADEDEGSFWFTACGAHGPQGDPYHCNLFRGMLDGTQAGDPTRLTPEDTDHTVGLSPGGEYFWDRHGTIGTPVECVVRRSSDGHLVARLWMSDYRDYEAAAPHGPLRIALRSADGHHELYGILYLPSDFDPARKYPLVDNIYGFPQTIVTPKRHPFGKWQALAELGCVVLVMDGSGTAYRSKAFHDASYGRLEIATADDHVDAIRQLSARYEWIDASRAGIFGSSGGGYATLAAMLRYPGVYQVGAAMSTDCDYRDSIPYHLAKYQDPAGRAAWDRTDLRQHASALCGDLLLVWGELDDNVHPRGMTKMLGALIAAGKHPDVLVVPGADHRASETDYVLDRISGYLIDHLR